MPLRLRCAAFAERAQRQNMLQSKQLAVERTESSFSAHARQASARSAQIFVVDSKSRPVRRTLRRVSLVDDF